MGSTILLLDRVGLTSFGSLVLEKDYGQSTEDVYFLETGGDFELRDGELIYRRGSHLQGMGSFAFR